MHIKHDCLLGDNVTASNLGFDSFCDKCANSQFREVKMDLEIRVHSVDPRGEMLSNNKR